MKIAVVGLGYVGLPLSLQFARSGVAVLGLDIDPAKVEALNAARKPMNGSHVLVLGLAYKPNVDDDRESPSYVLMDLLKARGAEVAYYDPYVPVIRMTREHPHWAGTHSAAWNRETLERFDAIIIATNHQAVSYQELADWTSCIVDTRNAMAGVKTRPGQAWKA